MRYLNIKFLILCFILMLPVNGWTQRYGIIPQPKSLTERQGEFKINKFTQLYVPSKDSTFLQVAQNFAHQLNKVTGYKITVNIQLKKSSAHVIEFVKVQGMGREAYQLSVTPTRISINSTTPNGAFYGVQSLYQLMPAEVYGTKVTKNVKWMIPCCDINDEPRFSYRGMMLDCGRHFMPKSFILKFIDLLAMHKQNVFHWHLTEDQGWRIEIKKYPKLTQIGSWRSETTGYEGDKGDHTPYGGYYTQQDIREVVKYASQRFVTVIPEIELPGHASAALAAYPELGVFPDKQYKVATGWGVKKDIMSPTVYTFQFLENTFKELFPLFPSPIYSIGGDECPHDQWKESIYCQKLMKIIGTEDAGDLQTLFVNHMSRFLHNKGGKRIIGWDDILNNGANFSTIILSYRGHAPGNRAVWKNMDVVMCPNRWCYFDSNQEDLEKEPRAQGLFLPLRKVYGYFPISDTLSVSRYKYIIGVEGCIWTEFIQNPARVEYMAFPRSVALSEVGWCDKENKDWHSFSCRMLKEFSRLDQKKVGYSKAFYDVIFNFDRNEKKYPKSVELTIDYPDAEIHYTTNGTKPTRKSLVYKSVLQVNKGCHIRARGFKYNGKPIGIDVDKIF